MRSRIWAGRFNRPLFAGMVALASWFAVACGEDGSGDGDGASSAAGALDLRGSITVFAAASLTDAFTEIGEVFEAAHPEAEVKFNFAGSSALRAQIEEGAPVDVFASANTTHMDSLVEAGLAAAPAIFIHNSLIVITPSDNPAGLASLADLRKQGLKLVLAAAEVPVGRYARDMLAKAETDPRFGGGFAAAVLANLVSNESNVKQVVAKVQLGEADVGIVYGSDVTPDVAQDLHTIEVPESVNVTADYPIVTLTEAGDPDLAKAFVDFVLGTEAQTILARWGFSPV